METLLAKLEEKLNQQTMIITTTVTRNVMEALDEKLKSVIEENNNLKIKVENLERQLGIVHNNNRKNNLIFFGTEEKGKKEGELVDYITDIIIDSGTHITSQEINNVYRIGQSSNKNRPVVVTFTSLWKKHQIQQNKGNLPTGIYIKEDYPKDVLEVRKNLQPILEEERKKGNIAFIKYDKLVVKKPNDTNREKRKREKSGSPNSPLQKKIYTTNLANKHPKTVSKDQNKPNILKHVERGRGEEVVNPSILNIERGRSVSLSDISKN